jgi:hypothetical protein
MLGWPMRRDGEDEFDLADGRRGDERGHIYSGSRPKQLDSVIQAGVVRTVAKTSAPIGRATP